MNNNILFINIGFLIASLYLTKVYLINNYLLDKYRQNLFRVREKLFDLALDSKSKIDFNDSIYVEFRDFINYMIRFAHELNYLSILIIDILNKIDRIPEKYYSFDKIEENINKISDKYTKNQLEILHSLYVKAVFYYMFFYSPLFFLHVIIILVKNNFSIKKTKYNIKSAQSSPLYEIENAAKQYNYA